MAIELEAKVRVEDTAAVRAKLQSLSATVVSHRRELNIYFDTADHKLLAGDQGLRIRSIWPIGDASTKSDKHIVTFKGPQKRGCELKSREEIELRVDDNEAATALLARLGYQPELGFEKRRESWKLGECLIEIDELPVLGNFVEVEGPTETAVKNVLAKIGLSSSPLITTSYIAMLSDYVKESGSSSRVIRFE